MLLEVKQRFTLLRHILWQHGWTKLLLPVWALLGTYDLFLSEFVSEEQAGKWPKLSRVIAMLNWWEWLSIGVVIFAVACFEYAFQQWRKGSLAEVENNNAPDWTIRDLFFYIRPDLVEDSRSKTPELVGKDIIDKCSMGQLKIWGCAIEGSKRRALAEISTGEWQRAAFAFGFLDVNDTQTTQMRTQLMPGAAELRYTNLQLRKVQALTIWSKSQLPALALTNIIHESTDEPGSAQTYVLEITNRGDFFKEHLVKVTFIRDAEERDLHASLLPLALRTAEQTVRNETGSFKLRKNEVKKIPLCFRSTRGYIDAVAQIEMLYERGSASSLPGEKGARYLVRIEMHGADSNTVHLRVGVDDNNRLRVERDTK